MSTFQAKPLTLDDDEPTPTTPKSTATTKSSSAHPSPPPPPPPSTSQRGIQRVALAPCFPPLYAPYPSILCRSPSKTPFFSSHNFLGFLLFNLVAACVFLPILAVNVTTVYLQPVDNQLYNNLIPGFNLTKMQLIGIFVFVCADLFLYLIVYFTVNYSNVFYGCSTEMNYKVFTGTQFIPIILIIRLLQPLTVMNDQMSEVDNVFIWSLRCLICVFLFVSIMPILYTEVRLLRGVNGLPQSNYYDFYNPQKDQQIISHKRKMPAFLFFALKVTLLFCFLLEMSVINFGIISPMSIDYPLIFSAANLIFIFYSHRPIIVKYNIMETGKTAITSEFGCIDGRRCCNKYRPNKLLAYERTETTFLQTSSCEYTFYSQKETPKWLQFKLNKLIRKPPRISKY